MGFFGLFDSSFRQSNQELNQQQFVVLEEAGCPHRKTIDWPTLARRATDLIRDSLGEYWRRATGVRENRHILVGRGFNRDIAAVESVRL